MLFAISLDLRFLTFLQLKEPEHEIMTIHADQEDETATQALREKMQKIRSGRYGKKVLIKFDAK